MDSWDIWPYHFPKFGLRQQCNFLLLNGWWLSTIHSILNQTSPKEIHCRNIWWAWNFLISFVSTNYPLKASLTYIITAYSSIMWLSTIMLKVNFMNIFYMHHESSNHILLQHFQIIISSYYTFEKVWSH